MKMIPRIIALCIAAGMFFPGCNKNAEDPETPETKTLGVPQSVTLSNAGETSLSFSWKAVDGAESYFWRLTKDHTSVADGTVSGTSVTVGDLQKGSTGSCP